MGICLDSFDRSRDSIFYTNGMTTTLDEAEKVRKEIEAIAEMEQFNFWNQKAGLSLIMR